MNDPVQGLAILMGTVFAVGCCASGAVAAIALTCRWLGWAPVLVTIHVHHHPSKGE